MQYNHSSYMYIQELELNYARRVKVSYLSSPTAEVCEIRRWGCQRFEIANDHAGVQN